MSILVVNAGSSSLKFALFDDPAKDTLASGLIDWGGTQDQARFALEVTGQPEIRRQLGVSDFNNAVREIMRALEEAGLLGKDRERVTSIGHRVVHGGIRFRRSVRIDRAVKAGIGELVELAPLHNPSALQAIEATEAALPNTPGVAVFDTAFFADLPESSFVYPVPYAWYTAWGVRRFGFHGISHAYCARRAMEMLHGAAEKARLIICHLGNGCSASAVRGTTPVATTMGFTPMEGLMMGSRSGSVDPGILLYVQQRRGLTAEQLDRVLNHESGLLGVSGISLDYRQVEAAAVQGNARARLALDMYAQRVRATIGALAVTLGGVDALVFAAGVGEHSASLRAAACDGLECLGLRLDPERNTGAKADEDIAASHSSARIFVLHTREELMIAREAAQLARTAQ